MKTFHFLTAFTSLLMLSLAFGWVAGGCATSSSGSSAPKPGRGIAEYREVAREAHRAVTAAVKSLEALAQSQAQTPLQHPALPSFDRAFHQLELVSVRTRARAEAIMARGQAYFEEWKENLSGITNRAKAQAETERYACLLDHFGNVRERSAKVREEFRPFMTTLREFRARLDQPVGAAGGELSRQELDGMTASGQRVLQALEAVSTALNEAEAELRATLAAGR